MKRPQQTASSPPSQAEESACDTNALVHELGDMELPNFSSNNMALSAPSTNIALQNYNSDATNMMNWNTGATDAVNSLTWPLLSTNLSMNSLLLTALHLRGHGAAAAATDNYSYMAPSNMINPFGSGGHDFASSSFDMASTSSLPHPPPPSTEQPPYNVDSNIW